jgi:cytochrome c peroxidase
MQQKSILPVTIALLMASAAVSLPATGEANGLTQMEQLGKEIFFDKISDPDRMACATCHDPQSGWTGPIPGINKKGAVYRGAVPQRFGNRKPPSAAYATDSPVFYFDGELFVGGNFWDGRATGEKLGNPAADQAGAPFVNPVEQHNPSKLAVCKQVEAAKYAGLYEVVWEGEPNCSPAEVDTTYDRIALSIAAYEGSEEVNQFSSKYDAYLVNEEVELTEQEAWGRALFMNEVPGEEGKDANCVACHPPPLFTDFTYDNLGTPRNPDNPWYDMKYVYLEDGTPINPKGDEWVDLGLGGFLETRPEWADMAAENMGKQKVPTLRNVAKAAGNKTPKSYGHNGYFKSLKSIVHFYNTKDVKPRCPDPFTSERDALRMDCWPAAEIAQNVNTDELGDLGLTSDEEDALVAFMKTLSDGYFERGKSGK